MGLSIGALPSLAIGVGAFCAGELVFETNKKIKKSDVKTMEETLADARNKCKEINSYKLKIEDEELVKYIDQIQDTVSKIIDTLEKRKEKYKNMNSFFNYYLPVTLNILNKYDEIENQRLNSEESKKFMVSTKNMMKKLNDAYKKQLSGLYQSDIINTDAEIKVLDSMLKSDGYNIEDDFKTSKEGKN